MKFFISTGYTNYYRYLFIFLVIRSQSMKIWRFSQVVPVWALWEGPRLCQNFYPAPQSLRNRKITRSENTIRWLLDYYCWWKLTGRLIHFIQTDKGTNTNVQSTDEKIQILENKFLDRDIIYLKKINCRRFFFSRFFPFILSGALPLILMP